MSYTDLSTRELMLPMKRIKGEILAANAYWEHRRGTIPADVLWERIIEGAYENGEPSVICLARVNKERQTRGGAARWQDKKPPRDRHSARRCRGSASIDGPQFGNRAEMSQWHSAERGRYSSASKPRSTAEDRATPFRILAPIGATSSECHERSISGVNYITHLVGDFLANSTTTSHPSSFHGLCAPAEAVKRMRGMGRGRGFGPPRAAAVAHMTIVSGGEG